MKLYLISWDVPRQYDTYDSAVVAAESADDAATIHPSGRAEPTTNEKEPGPEEWCKLSEVQVKYVGEAADGVGRGVICASYNAS